MKFNAKEYSDGTGLVSIVVRWVDRFLKFNRNYKFLQLGQRSCKTMPSEGFWVANSVKPQKSTLIFPSDVSKIVPNPSIGSLWKLIFRLKPFIQVGQQMFFHPYVIISHVPSKPPKPTVFKIYYCQIPPRFEVMQGGINECRPLWVYHRKWIGKNNDVCLFWAFWRRDAVRFME